MEHSVLGVVGTNHTDIPVINIGSLELLLCLLIINLRT